MQYVEGASMSCRRCCGKLLALVACAFGIGAFCPSVASAQTLEVQEEGFGLLQAEPTGIDYFKWVWRWANILSTEIDTTQFRGPLTFKEGLGIAYEQCQDKGIELPILVDHAAFVGKVTDNKVYDVPMEITGLPKRVPLSRLLMEMLDQLPDADATIVVRNSYLEITTVRAVGRSGLSFHIARRIAPIVRFWSLAGLVAALAFVAFRAWSVWRPADGRLFGLVVLMLGGVLVWLFWPIWLVIVGVQFLRKRNSTKSLA